MINETSTSTQGNNATISAKIVNENMKPAIICIDDDQSILNSLNQQLKRRFGKKFHYEFAESAEEGLEIIEELVEEGRPIVMVVSDQIMPGMTGDKFLVNVHLGDPKSIKVLLTGQAAVDSAINAINNANLFSYLTKPWEEEDLLLTLERGLEQYYLIDELEEKNQELADTNKIFKCFVPDPIQQRIAKNGVRNLTTSAAEEGGATVLFSDLRSFSTYAELHSPTETLEFLNHLMNPLIPVIHKYKGFINQFVGDATMSIFYDQDPHDADRALGAAIEMQQEFSEAGRRYRNESGVTVKMGLGLNSGEIITGLIGDENRMDAAVVGDTVNLAARMENLTKFYGLNILVTKFTLDKVTALSKYHIRPVDLVRVYGKKEVVEIYEIFDADDGELKAAKSSLLSEYNAAIKFFRELEFEQAEVLFQSWLKHIPQDRVAEIYLRRYRDLRISPPQSGWDGVFDQKKFP